MLVAVTFSYTLLCSTATATARDIVQCMQLETAHSRFITVDRFLWSLLVGASNLVIKAGCTVFMTVIRLFIAMMIFMQNPYSKRTVFGAL